MGVFRGHLEIGTRAVTELEQVAITQPAVEPQIRGVGAVAVVEFQRPVQRPLVLHVEVDVHRARFHALAQYRGHQDRGHAPVRQPVEPDDVLGHPVHVRHGALRQRRCLALDVARQEKPCAIDPQAADLALDDFEFDHAAARVLLRDEH